MELYQILLNFLSLQQTEKWTTESISTFVDRYFNFWLVDSEIKQKQ